MSWYETAVQVLGPETVGKRLDVLEEMRRILAAIIPRERGRTLGKQGAPLRSGSGLSPDYVSNQQSVLSTVLSVSAISNQFCQQSADDDTLEANNLISSGSDANVSDRRTNELLQPIEISASRRRQLVVRPNIGCGGFPAVHPLVLRLGIV